MERKTKKRMGGTLLLRHMLRSIRDEIGSENSDLICAWYY